ncbi:unnamed protein product [Kuraishia capsulata CBS 1993]|uniref:Bud emergence protein 1 n=1 Tax=Kuraishia capsulata CBS 1993 TaxID=1382522 RepID=W6MRU2_9ASCO|nr:uncharacterized protein KUCA_T00005422001 [Kuraishia capsulata CBS 1993]CDK29434.1 unnamed protein product [Kuraishia capsulata CBS 1993]
MLGFRRSSKDKKSPKTPKQRSISSASSISYASSPLINSSSNDFANHTKVIQAKFSYTPQRSGEIGFDEGDFFFVAENASSSQEWIEAQDPNKNLKGLVPTSHFKFLEKSNRLEEINESLSPGPGLAVPPKRKSLTILYARVLYDFKGERSDELSVTAGENIIICAHHSFEWFIAKPITRLGGPGLVPVSYVQLLDMTTRMPSKLNVRQVIETEELPTVEQWKVLNAKYKAGSIVVGGKTNDYPNSHQSVSRNGSIGDTNRTSMMKKQRFQSQLDLVSLYVTEVDTESFANTSGKYWYLVRVALSNGSTRSLCRFYEDFFNFHQTVLNAFPREAGKVDGVPRVLPYIPGPLADINESLCHKRLPDLDRYLKELVGFPEYISRTQLIQSFFNLKDGDKQFAPTDDILPVHPLRPPPDLIVLPNTGSGNSPDENYYPQQQQQQQQQQLYTSIAMRNSQYQQDRMSQYENVKRNSIPLSQLTNRMSGLNIAGATQRQTSSSSSSSVVFNQQAKDPMPSSDVKLKLKFYYKYDIFAIVVADNSSLADIKTQVLKRVDESDLDGSSILSVHLYPKDSTNASDASHDAATEIVSDEQLWSSPAFVDKGRILVVVDEA